ncbi:Hint domain-containing protein [Planktomarina temperata]|nr:Hint domain-containing protein [Planktomarina temperata]
MPEFFVTVIANSSFGMHPSAINLNLGSQTIPGAGDFLGMYVTDDDAIFDDEINAHGNTLDLSSQVLSRPFNGYPAGRVVQSVYINYITNNTTGVTGAAHLIKIYTGTDPNNPGAQDGETYWAFTIPVSPGDSISRTSDGSAAQIGYAALLCFTGGTLIKTQSGERPIEELAAGDMVVTMDHGPQPIRWIGSSKRRATGNMAPILIRKGALGNTRDLRVSPQHRMLLSSWHAEVLFGEREVLATAKSLVNDHSILREEGGEVEYFHMLFDTHEIVYAEGTPSESFHPGPEGWKALDMPTRNEILELFPQLANGNFDSYGPSARASLKHKEGSLLSHSMISQTQH